METGKINFQTVSDEHLDAVVGQALREEEESEVG